MIEIENVLTKNLSVNSRVDGHDAGSGEMNIFVHTDDPVAAFNEVKSTLGSCDFWVDARVAYREVAKSGFTILWPKDLKVFKIT